jgi:predicted double-glycine peptidase
MNVGERILLEVKSIEQQYKYNCGPTALLICLNYQYGLPLTQRDVNLLTGVTPDGCSEYHLFRALDILGFKYEESCKGTLSKLLDYLKRNIVPIVHIVLEDGGGHYVVIVGMDEEFVYLADPRTGTIIKWGIPFFLGVWKEEAKDNSSPWYLAVIGKSSHQKLDSLINKFKRIRKKLLKVQL